MVAVVGGGVIVGGVGVDVDGSGVARGGEGRCGRPTQRSCTE